MATTLTSAPPAPPRRLPPVGVRLPVPRHWAEAIDAFLLDREAAGRPATSRRSYRSALEHIARRTPLGPYQQTRATLREYIAGQPDWSVETRRARRSTLVAFYDWAVTEELMEHNPARQLPRVKATAPRPKPAPHDIYQAALRAAAPRERLMLRLSFELGMRRDEVARVHTRDVWEDFGGGFVLDVHGKGAKTRQAPVPESLYRELAALPEGYVFPGNRAGHLSAEYVGRKIAALLPGDFTMHALRHSYATRLYQLSGDLLTVQDALGHASPDTTRRYIAVDNRAKLRALNETMAQPQWLGRAG